VSRAGHPWWLGLAATLGAMVVGALGATWRVRRVDQEERDAALARGERWIFALWHARLLALTYTHRGRGVAVLISQHRDGELIARLVRHLGFVTPRGSSTRGGGEGARALLGHAGERRLLAITPDGPRGPARRVKPGLIWLASRSGLPIVPAAAAASREWRMRSWDGFRVPQPFARVLVGYGPPIAVPAELDETGTEHWRARVEAAIDELTDRIDRELAGRAPARAPEREPA
jgi:lysophospholipid acyltransferase (LPLAT)-like uncharacterized protein